MSFLLQLFDLLLFVYTCGHGAKYLRVIDKKNEKMLFI